MGYVIWPDGLYGDLVRDVYDELGRQDDKWGPQDRPLLEWLAILAEEFGELAQEVVELDVPPTLDGDDRLERLANVRKEAIQVAASALRFAEKVDVDRQVQRQVTIGSLWEKPGEPGTWEVVLRSGPNVHAQHVRVAGDDDEDWMVVRTLRQWFDEDRMLKVRLSGTEHVSRR